jgi:hypothetical protein
VRGAFVSGKFTSSSEGMGMDGEGGHAMVWEWEEGGW